VLIDFVRDSAGSGALDAFRPGQRVEVEFPQALRSTLRLR
jgi:hypothetical protein